MPNTMYARLEFRESPTLHWNAATGCSTFRLYTAEPVMSRKKARKAYRAAEDEFYAAQAAAETAECEAEVQRAAMDAARKRMDEAAHILASDK